MLLELWAIARESRHFSWDSSQLCSLKTEETPAGRLALGDWLGRYRVGIFT